MSFGITRYLICDNFVDTIMRMENISKMNNNFSENFHYYYFLNKIKLIMCCFNNTKTIHFQKLTVLLVKIFLLLR